MIEWVNKNNGAFLVKCCRVFSWAAKLPLFVQSNYIGHSSLFPGYFYNLSTLGFLRKRAMADLSLRGQQGCHVRWRASGQPDLERGGPKILLRRQKTQVRTSTLNNVSIGWKARNWKGEKNWNAKILIFLLVLISSVMIAWRPNRIYPKLVSEDPCWHPGSY